MYVKLAFSVAAHLDSEIMIMDEVLAVGDMKFQQKCLGRMGDAAEKEGRTVLYVSHNMNTIRQLCTRCIVLSEGQIIYDGDVDSAIQKYLETNAQEMGTEINLTQSRMSHLSSKVVAKIEHVSLLGKDEPVYEFDEAIAFEVRVRSQKAISRPCFRLEIRNEDDMPIGAVYAHSLSPIDENGTQKWKFTLRSPRLVTGKYKALLVLYEINEFGTYNDLDAVFPGFTFAVTDTNGVIKINWNHNRWGKVLFEKML
jgi:lipopolysaccharide transport system ATP-binding protein